MNKEPRFSDKIFVHSVIKFNEHGIFEIHCADEYVFELADIKEIHTYLESCSKEMNEKVLVVSYATRLNIIGIDSMQYLSRGPHQDFIRAEAFVIKSVPQRLLGNFYMRNLKPIVPAKVFTEKEEATKWLLEFRS